MRKPTWHEHDHDQKPSFRPVDSRDSLNRLPLSKRYFRALGRALAERKRRCASGQLSGAALAHQLDVEKLLRLAAVRESLREW